jgi:hypothetical protein
LIYVTHSTSVMIVVWNISTELCYVEYGSIELSYVHDSIELCYYSTSVLSLVWNVNAGLCYVEYVSIELSYIHNDSIELCYAEYVSIEFSVECQRWVVLRRLCQFRVKLRTECQY